jgi:hypothetical protein
MTTRGRETLREVMLRNQAAMDQLAAISGKPRVLLDIPPEPAILSPRKASGQPTEAQILKSVMQLLKHHPRVASCWRVNSGTFQERNRDGSVRYIRANTAKGMSDIMGVLKDGRTLAIEVKSATGRMRPGQEEFLATIRHAGGVAGVCRSVEDAQALLAEAV